jgi:glycerophosphoryl diester phosphodiesterase
MPLGSQKTAVNEQQFLCRGQSGRFAFFLAVSSLLMTVQAAQASDLITSCPIVAHRGYSYVAPENTLLAIELAIDVGAYGSEFDVYKCASGELVVMHDSTVNRTTNGSGTVTQLNWSYLQGLVVDFKPPHPLSWPTEPTQYVPTMNQALAALKDSGTAAICEIKQTGIADSVISCLTNADMLGQSAVISFLGNEILATENINSNVVTGLLMGSGTVKSNGTTTTAMADTIAGLLDAYNADFADVESTALTQPLMTELAGRGIHVWAYTVDNQATMQTLLDWGVDGITTNRPDLGVVLVPEPGCFAMLASVFVVVGAWGCARRRRRCRRS